MSGKKITNIRVSRNLSLEKLASMLEPTTSATQILRLETGERRLTKKWVTRIAAALGVSPYDIWGDSDMMVTAEERELIERIRQLPDASRTAIFATVKNLSPGEPTNSEDDPNDDT